MHSPALAIGWQIWGRARWWAFYPPLALAVHWAATRAVPEVLRPVVVACGGLLFLPVFVYLLVLHLNPDAPSFAKANVDGFPPRMFTLPLRPTALVFWPMLSGITSFALVWIAIVAVACWPNGVRAPLGLPALGLAAGMAFFQAVSWSPFGSPFVRSLVVILAGPGMVAAAIWADAAVGRNHLILWVLFPAYIVGSFLVAVAGVRYARSGGGTSGPPAFLNVQALLERSPGRRRSFASAAQALRWYEWRDKGLILPYFVGLILVFCLASVSWTGAEAIKPLGFVLAMTVGMPLVLASSFGARLARPEYWGPRPSLTAFLATRPVTDGAFVMAKLEMAALSTLLAWGVASFFFTLWLVLTGNLAMFATLGGRLAAALPAWKMLVLVPLVLIALFVVTWRGLVGGLALGLTGRPALIGAVGVLGFLVGGSLLCAGIWFWSRGYRAGAVADQLPWLLVTLGMGKGLAAWLSFRTARRRGLMTTRTIGTLVAAWLLAGLCLSAVVLLLPVPTPPFPRPALVATTVLLVPLARLGAAPLALAWDRHR